MFGRFASMRDTYLRENKPVMYEQMLREGRLRLHLEETDVKARQMREQLIEQMLEFNPAPERKNQMEWVHRMNTIHCTAAEIVCAETISI